MFVDEISHIEPISHPKLPINFMFHVSIYIKENAINIEVQQKVLLNVFLGL